MKKTNDQKTHWNNLHSKKNLDPFSIDQTGLAKEAADFFPKNSKLLELGCGVGNDSVFFAKKGFNIFATDFSNIVIDKNSSKYSSIQNLHFEVLDIYTYPLPFENDSFDEVYARLSLHYFPDKVTKKIFKEIARILRHEGKFVFMCKSTDDPLYGKGEQIEKDIFIYEGHVRHFFSEEYALECLKNHFTLISIESGSEDIYGKRSSFVKVKARK